MRINKKYMGLSFVALIAVVLIGIGSASAQGIGGKGVFGRSHTPEEQGQVFAEKAEVLGITVDQFKEYWVDGKNIKDILSDMGIDEDEWRESMQEYRKTKMEEHLQELVATGIINQEQADKRVESMEERRNGLGFGGKAHRGRMGGGMKNGGRCPLVDGQ